MQERAVNLLHLPRTQQRAGGGFMSYFYVVRMSSTSLACNSETEVDICHPQRTIDLARPHSCVS
jgi:hypothetical protein